MVPEDSHESIDARANGDGALVELSLVIPVFDEEENLPELHAEIVRHRRHSWWGAAAAARCGAAAPPIPFHSSAAAAAPR